MQLDYYGNLLYAGWAYREPYGWDGTQTSWATAVQQGYIALIDKRGMPFWVYKIKDEQKTGTVPDHTLCTYARHVKLLDNDYIFAGCNVWRSDLITGTAGTVGTAQIGSNQAFW
jgi:hypothetical protein